MAEAIFAAGHRQQTHEQMTLVMVVFEAMEEDELAINGGRSGQLRSTVPSGHGSRTLFAQWTWKVRDDFRHLGGFFTTMAGGDEDREEEEPNA